MSFRTLAFTLTALASLAQPARALTFSFTTVSGDTLSTTQAAAFQAAADAWSAALSDAITLNLQIGFSSTLGSGVLGSTTPTILYGSKATVVSLLTADEKDAADRQAVASLGTSTQSSIAVTSAEAKALGATLPTGITSDGTIQFSSTYSFSTSRNADGSVAAGTYDLIGIAEHEIGHLLGFASSIDGGTGSYQTLLDQFRYAAASTRSVVAGASAYFSIDNGATDLANFSVGGSSNSQASHWLSGTAGVMIPEAGTGQVLNITALDIAAMDVLGYDVTAVPEPWSLGLLAVGLLGAVGTRRRI